MKTSLRVIRLRARLGVLALVFFLVGFGCGSQPSARGAATSTPVPAVSQDSLGGTDLPSVTPPVVSADTATIQPTELSSPDVVREMLSEVDSDRVISNLKRLTGGEPICNESGCHTIANRLTGSEGLGWAKDYVRNELSGLGYSVELQDWSSSGYTDQNIIARKAGTSLPNEEVYFVAHLDGVKRLPGIPFPAADDNASGVVDLLELARVLSSHSFDRTVVLLFSTGEEQGALGVWSYIDQLSPEKLDSIRYVIDVDMIGYDGNGDGGMQLWSGDDVSSLALAQRLSRLVKVHEPALVPSVVTGCT